MAKPNGVVYLCKNVPLSMSSAHTIDFLNPSEQSAYWGSFVKYRISEVSYVRRTRQYIVVDKPLADVQDINYLYYQAKEDHKTYYCWVTGKEYLGENSTTIYFDTDVLQTYMFDYEFKESFVVQEHTDRWNANHKPIYSRTDEGLDYGSEYTLENAYKIIQGPRETYTTTDRDGNTITRTNYLEKYALIYCVEHSALVEDGANAVEPTKIQGVANPYILYLAPLTAERYISGDVGFETTTLVELNDIMAKTTFGNYVKQIVILPYLPLDHKTYGDPEQGVKGIDFGDSVDTITALTRLQDGDQSFDLIRLISINEKGFKKLLAEMPVERGIESAYPTAEQWSEIKANPYTTERDKRFESKLLCHPYRYNILTDWRNNPLIVKNEYLTGDKIQVNVVGSFGFNAPFRYYVANYKGDPEGRSNSITQALQFDHPIMTDAYQNYMLQNRNQIMANQTNKIVSSVTNVASGVVGNLATGNYLGAAIGGVTGAVEGAVNYQNMVRAENAKQSDIKNLPDSIVGSNESAINMIDDNTMLTFYRYKICCEFEEQLADIFNMTGYTIKRMKVPNLKSRVRFNYIKTRGANIIGSFDQQDLARIKAYYDNGLTIWHYNSTNFKPYDYSLENIERSLL